MAISQRVCEKLYSVTYKLAWTHVAKAVTLSSFTLEEEEALPAIFQLFNSALSLWQAAVSKIDMCKPNSRGQEIEPANHTKPFQTTLSGNKWEMV